MPKSRRCNPTTENDGIWFPHRCHDDGRPLFREKSTSTGKMLTDPFQPEASYIPPDPPEPFKAKDTKVFKHHNKFSDHDNRLALGNHGEIFGTAPNPRSVGRRLNPDPVQDAHHSETDMLTHYGRDVTRYDYNTVYSDNFRGCQSQDSNSTGCRKYPRRYPDPIPGLRPFNTFKCISNELASEESFIKVPSRRTIEMLGQTQRLPDRDCSSWKYSYHGIPRCYPGGYSRIDASNPYPGWFLKDNTSTLPPLNLGRSNADVAAS